MRDQRDVSRAIELRMRSRITPHSSGWHWGSKGGTWPACSYSTPLCTISVASPPSSTMSVGPDPSGHSIASLVHHQYSSSVSPFQANTGVPFGFCTVPPVSGRPTTAAAAAWSWVEKMLQDTQRTSAPSSASVSTRPPVRTGRWALPAMLGPRVAWRGLCGRVRIRWSQPADAHPVESGVDSHPADFDVRGVGLSGAELGYRPLDVGAGGGLGPLSLAARQGMQRGPASILFDDALDCQRHQLAAVECRVRLHERMIGLVPQKSLLLVTVQAARRRRPRLVLERPQQFLELQPLFDGHPEIGFPVHSAQQRLLRRSRERRSDVFERDRE